jgi:PDZ domain
VTPATNNYTGGRYASAPRLGASHSDAQGGEPYQTARSMTPNGRYTPNAMAGGVMGSAAGGEPRTPSSTGLIRLSLKKPMGIVFEPMYDPNNAAIQRGVRICDLPRTGAAALSRKLQVGDELLQINDTTVSRLTFDEIMDFIIEADPDSVNLLFRRPRKETLQARQGVQQKLNAAANKDAVSTVKWVDDEVQDPDGKKSKKKKKKSKRSKKSSVSDEDETLQSKSTNGEDSYLKTSSSKKSKSSKSKSVKRSNPYETESFLDMLIDTICSDSSNVCRDTFRRNEDEYVSEDESFATEEDTYATYEEDGTRNAEKEEKPNTSSKKKYEDDGTLETVETRDRPDVTPIVPAVPPLGLAPNPPPIALPRAAVPLPVVDEPTDYANPAAPIKELEYDDRMEADVSVMESLGGPSLLIEKQRAAQAAASQQLIPLEILEKYGLDYPIAPGMSREKAISSDPVRFYTHVVKQLLQDHEPEKVRLLDKLLAKYKGREDHLVQKLAVRYNKEEQQQADAEAFSDAVKKNKQSLTTANAVNTAKERLQQHHVVEDEEDDEDYDDEPRDHYQWPDKETKEQDEGDEVSESGSEYSRESVDGTSPAVIAQVSELLNYVYGKTSVPGQIDRVSTIMRAYEGREAVLLELLETKALIKANKEKENADSLPSFLRNSQLTSPAAPQPNDENNNHNTNATSGLPPVTPMATNPQGGTVINDDISSMSGVSSPAAAELLEQHEVEAPPHMTAIVTTTALKTEFDSPMKELPKLNSSFSLASRNSKPPTTPDKRKKKGLFGGLFGKKKTKDSTTPAASTERPVSRLRNVRKLKGGKSVEGSI